MTAQASPKTPDAISLMSGCAYGREAPHSDDTLYQVGPGTPCGELLRRYWHPIELSEKVGPRPILTKVLGEDLVLFRDRSGRPGLLYPRCMHRGTSLYYGKVEEKGIRCCYHGWLYDVQGRCLNQPCEPGGGRRTEVVRQPWYPVEERYGLVFAYMGPPQRKPALPRYDNLENARAGEVLSAFVGGFGSTADRSLQVVPHSWCHMNENALDPFHVYILHSTFSTVHFSDRFGVMPEVDFFRAEHGVCYSALRALPYGGEITRISTWLLPNIATVLDLQLKPGQASGISWFVPVDDRHFRHVIVARVPEGTELKELRLLDGKRWCEMTDAEHQDTPGDYEAQVGQGPIPLHSEEHLVSSDRGIAMQRALLREQMEVVANGGDPLGVRFDPAAATVKVKAGNFMSSPPKLETSGVWKHELESH